MYRPELFAESRLDVLYGLMRERPLATLVTASAGRLDADHLPLLLSPQPAPLGSLHGHVARANPLWRAALAADVEVLAIFSGAQAYITPSWYPAKAEHGEVVPTWNYAVVHAHGMMRAVEDPARLRAHLEALTAANEAARPQPWHVADAPREFTERLIAGIVGIEIVITRLEGKWKVSQNQTEANRCGVVAGLRGQGDPASLEMAALVEARGKGL